MFLNVFILFVLVHVPLNGLNRLLPRILREGMYLKKAHFQ
ncbi:hypothetical protein HMPREF9441_02246 [Paraprevotella clara YIT 11840]|uniref:Uncharacterized protein n=1 Tax=Paraprevotella clara YIT 11840 TaxID=762968 RepID=G5SS97_9BACT|nr:hypothetical protein HMPREF9441_02246 [Paraprevotella clara YIT 11840]